MSTRSLLPLTPALALSAACAAAPAPPPPVAPPAPIVATPAPLPAPVATPPPEIVDASPSFGTFASTGGLLGAFEASPGYCQLSMIAKDGQTSSGVLFTKRLGDFHPSLTALVTPKGSGVVVEVGNPSRMLALKAKQCSRLDVRVPSGAGGTGADVEIDCDAGGGARVRASLHAASCH